MLQRVLFVLWAVLLPVMAFAQTTPAEMQKTSSWGAIKALYRSELADSTQMGRVNRGEVSPSRLHPDNRIAIQYECYYALRQSWGYISWQSATSSSQRSNWAYLLSDPNAHSKAVEWYGADASMWKGWPSYYTNMDVYSWTALNRSGVNTGTVRSHGGQCRSFAALILYRAGVRTTKLPAYVTASARPYNQIRIGDVIETNWVNGHTAIVVGIVEGAAGSSVSKVVVVDSNYLSDEEIGMHVLAVGASGVNGLQNYRALNLGY